MITPNSDQVNSTPQYDCDRDITVGGFLQNNTGEDLGPAAPA